ncbi:MAG: beta-galactosidase trimerization domain-containing protein [Planctomycetes bacterium]|nr:beta-galactosidase trimerization domain-containing protein [Planctomycetota bacterium]
MKCSLKALCLLSYCLVVFASQQANAESIFIEAESMQPSSSGWVLEKNAQSRRASRATTLWGATGDVDAVAQKKVRIKTAGKYRIWVRYMQVAAWRGPFQVTVTAGEKNLNSNTFDLKVIPGVSDWEYTWQSFNADLPAGDVTLSMTKHDQKNCVGYVRHVDCLLLTTDEKLEPDHLPYAPQTLVRVTIGEGYDRPVYMHLFADHYRSPWYAHYAIGTDGIRKTLAPPKDQMLKSGDVTPWCNLTPTIYQDSGAALNLSVRHTYYEKATNFRAKLEFGRPTKGGSTGNDVEVIKTFNVEATPNGLVIITPPDLESPVNIARLKRDQEFAEEVGKLADAFNWPEHGRKPETIPMLASASIGGYQLPVDNSVTEREQKTLAYYSFNGTYNRLVHGLWFTKERSYCRPDLEAMHKRVKHDVEKFRESGRRLDDIAACVLMDEPTGQPAAFMAKDKAYHEHFRKWLKSKSLTPEDLLVSNWDEVRPVVETERDQFPALHYYTQFFRTRALGNFMTTQKRIIEEAYGHSFPTIVNFSDGAIYHANFCGQGVNYFELLDDDDQNAIWGEDWANNSSTYQCGAFNVALMQAAARKRGQKIGHYLISHANRTPWDLKTKAIAETARGVRMWMNFAYGPNWSSHEGGPAWRSHLWHAKPELWTANAEITREIGAVEDWLLTAKPTQADVALLYSSSSDIWTMQSNLSYGFDRMHTWLSLTHAQTPVDIVPEREFDRLDQYKVCYLSGPNLTRAAAEKLSRWVQSGGTLWLTAGAATRDEFNRPLNILSDTLPVERGELKALQSFHGSGRFLGNLTTHDTVTWDDTSLEVLSVKQPLSIIKPRLNSSTEAKVLATFKDGKPATISCRAGEGHVFMLGFLPGLSYIKPALAARKPLEQQGKKDRLAAQKLADQQAASVNANQPLATSASVVEQNSSSSLTGTDQELINRSYNPWSFPTGIRNRILTPVRAAKLSASLTCDTPLVDAVELQCAQGTLIALSNHTLQPLDRVELQLNTKQPIVQVNSIRQGALTFEQLPSGQIRFALPLDATDFVTVSTGEVNSHLQKKSELRIGKLPINKILFLGNSITLHGPAPKIGWTGNWGMAASAKEKDYVHVLMNRIVKEAGGNPRVMVKNIAQFERTLTDYNIREQLKQELKFEADVVIIALGENASSPTTDDARTQFSKAFMNLFSELKKQNSPEIFVRGQFWKNSNKDKLLKQACEKTGGIFIDTGKIGLDESSHARAERIFKHAGVAAHPGDKGMQQLAEAFWQAIQKQAGTQKK